MADRRALRRELGIPLETPVIGSLGRLDAIKGYDALIDAFVLLRRRRRAGKPPVLVIAGDGPELAPLRAQIAALPASDAAAIHLLGWRTDVRRVLSAFDLFAMASHSEGTSVSLLEGMSAGICPVVTDVGGNADVLGAELSRRLVPRGDPSGFVARFADALSDALSDTAAGRARRLADGRRARARVETAFGVTQMVRSYERIYTEVMS